MVQVQARVGLHKSVERVDVDLLMVNSHGKYIADGEGLAFARVGFLVYDWVGYPRRAIIGYGGGINPVDYIAKRIKGRRSRELPEGISTSQGMVQ